METDAPMVEPIVPDLDSVLMLRSAIEGTVSRWGLLDSVQRLGVGLSGGADSLALLDSLAALDFGIELVPLHVHQHVDQRPGHLQSYVEERLGLRTRVVRADSGSAASAAIANGKAPCRACAPIRAKSLGNAARALELDALALGHHLDDAAATLLMNIFHRGEIDTMRPTARRRTHPTVPLIRPLLFVPESKVKAASPVGAAGLFDCGMCSVHALERARAARFVAEMFGTHHPAPGYVAGLIAELAESRDAGRQGGLRKPR